jgi:hypothetical protein
MMRVGQEPPRVIGGSEMGLSPWRKGSRILIGILIAGLALIGLHYLSPILSLIMLFGGEPTILGGFLALWLLICVVAGKILIRVGAGRTLSHGIAIGGFVVVALLLAADLATRPSMSELRAAGYDYRKNVELTEVRVVHQAPGCPNRCVAGEMINRGDRTVTKVILHFDTLDSAGLLLRSTGGVMPLPPPGYLEPGAGASFLFTAARDLIGLNPRFAGARAKVGNIELEDTSVSRWLIRTILDLIHRFSRVSQAEKEWYTLDENMEYAKKVSVTARLDETPQGRYVVEGELTNEGSLPIRRATVHIEVLDREGRRVDASVMQVVRYAFQNLEGIYAPLPAGGKRAFRHELPEERWKYHSQEEPETLDWTLTDLSLGYKE